MFCPSCGKEIPEQSVFCPKCGQRINRNPAEGTASAVPPAVDQSPQAPVASANREAAGTAYKKTSTFGRNPLYRRIIMGIAAVMILAIVLVVSGISRSSENPTAGANGSADAKATADKSADAVKIQEDQAKVKLGEADSAFSKGDYDTALRLYRDIDTDYAKARVRAIECIPVADSVAKEWLEATDNEANAIVLATFGLDFTFDTEYDPQTYTFYTKMYYPSLYTDLATSFGTSRETIEEGVTSSGHEKTAYEMFCKRGYEDITCVSNMYDGDGGLLASFPYNKEIQKANAIRAQQEEEAAAAKAAQVAEEQERIRNEFITELNSNDEFWSAVDKDLKGYESKNKIEQVIDQYWRDHKDRWKYDSLSSFIIIEMEYGEPYVLDSEQEAEKTHYGGEMTAFDYGPVMIHLPCTAEVSAALFYGSNTGTVFDVELELVFETNPLVLRSPYILKQDAVAVVSMEEDEMYAPVIENPLDVLYPWVGMDTYSFAERSWGGVGETLSSDWFNFTVESVYAMQTYSGFSASAENQLIVATVWIENIYPDPIAFDDSDLRIYWEKGESSCGALQSITGTVLDTGETYSGTFVYEVPAEIQNFAIILCDGEPIYPKASVIGFSISE
ncbi:MAG: DUF4352 domain-containing protein [Oscillibacter sp.]|nr:DUF4352 domain-containing protein [Oscillibacter sp.]